MAKVIFNPGVPEDPDELREWLRKWHAEHNPHMATVEADEGEDLANFRLTEQGVLALAGNLQADAQLMGALN